MTETDDDTRQNPVALIVTADPDLRNILYYLVHKQGFAIEEADTKAEAIEKAQLFRPDLILLDLALGGSSGFETIRALQEEDETRGIPVALLCDKNIGEVQKQMIYQESNIKAALEKPVCSQTLTTVIRRLGGQEAQNGD